MIEDLYAELDDVRQSPQSFECEQGLLSSLLQDPNNRIPEAVHLLGGGSEAFYDLRHRLLYSTLVAMFDSQIRVDVISVHQKMKAAGEMDNFGGISYLNTIQDAAPSAANAPYYLEVVKEKWLLRNLKEACESIANAARKFEGDVDAFIDDCERKILAIRPKQTTRTLTIKELVNEAIADIEKRWETGGAITGLATGLVDLDRYSDGMRPGNLIVPAAYPSVGKTSLLMNIVEHVVLVEKRSAVVFSLEMSAKELVERFLSANARVNLRGRIYENDFPKLTMAAGKIANSNLHIIDECSTVEEIRAESRRLKQQHNVELIGVDYIQRVHTRNARRDANREQEISYIGNTLKSLAMELGIPIIAPSQLNDDGKLRESRAIGQDADQVWVLERDEKESTSETDVVQLRIAKNRGGPRGGLVDLTFFKKFTRFESASKISDCDVPR